MAPESDDVTPPHAVGPAMVLLLAVWVGLIAGFLDLGVMIANAHLDRRAFYRLGSNFAWIIPVGVTALVLAPALVIALFAKARKKSVSVGAAEGVLFFVGLLDVCAGCPCMSGPRCSFAVASPRS